MADNDDELDVEDVDISTSRSSRIVLPMLVLEALLTPEVRERIDRREVRTLVIAVPDASWVVPMFRAGLRIFGTRDTYYISVGEKRRYGSGEDENVAVASGRLVVAISQSPDELLAGSVRLACDLRIDVPTPDSAILTQLARRCLVSAPGIRFNDLSIAGLSFDEIAACFPEGATIDLALKRIGRAVRRPQAPSFGAIPLDAVDGYGAAQVWATELRQDIADLRAGRIAAEELDRGAVLSGVPGTGKSRLARIIAHSCELPAVFTSVSELMAGGPGYLGTVITNVRDVFARARRETPAMIFLDELDALPNRQTLTPRGQEYWSALIAEFLILLDSAVSDRSGTIVLAATNHIERVDPALLRPGRLERILHIDAPDAPALARILRHYLGGDLVDADLLSLTAARPGSTGAEAEEWARSARRKARRAVRPMIWEDLASSVLPPDPRSPQDLLRAAVHEAGHAVTAVLLGVDEVERVTIERSASSSGHTSLVGKSRDFALRDELESRVVCLLAGRAAEQVLLNGYSTAGGGDAASDLALATNLVCMWHCALGMAGDLTWRGSPDQAQMLMNIDAKLRAKVAGDLQRLSDRAEHLLRNHLTIVVAVSELLRERRSLNGNDLRSMVGGARARAVPISR
jgi:hypothetical protein